MLKELLQFEEVGTETTNDPAEKGAELNIFNKRGKTKCCWSHLKT